MKLLLIFIAYFIVADELTGATGNTALTTHSQDDQIADSSKSYI